MPAGRRVITHDLHGQINRHPRHGPCSRYCHNAGRGTLLSQTGETSITPIGTFYLKRVWEDSRTRNVISVFVNDLEYDKSFGNFELVTRFENNTIPFGQKEVVNNRETKWSDTEWGTRSLDWPRTPI